MDHMRSLRIEGYSVLPACFAGVFPNLTSLILQDKLSVYSFDNLHDIVQSLPALTVLALPLSMECGLQAVTECAGLQRLRKLSLCNEDDHDIYLDQGANRSYLTPSQVVEVCSLLAPFPLSH